VAASGLPLCCVPCQPVSCLCLSVTRIVLSASALWLDYFALYKYSYLLTYQVFLGLSQPVSCMSVCLSQVLSCLPSMPWDVPASELSYRRDLRSQCVFTIDPSTARDLDDAVSCEQLADG